MIHNLKMPDGTIKAVDCKIGTGLFDRNGKEIFEGDRVKNPRHNPDDPMSTAEYIVVYDPEQAAFVYRDKFMTVPHPNDPLPFLADDGDFEIVND